MLQPFDRRNLPLWWWGIPKPGKDLALAQREQQPQLLLKETYSPSEQLKELARYCNPEAFEEKAD